MSRAHPKTKATPLLELLEKFSKKEIADELGVHTGTLNSWASKNEMPVLARRACEGLLRRFARSGNAAQMLIVKCPQTQRETVDKMLEALGCKVFLVPFNE